MVMVGPCPTMTPPNLVRPMSGRYQVSAHNVVHGLVELKVTVSPTSATSLSTDAAAVSVVAASDSPGSTIAPIETSARTGIPTRINTRFFNKLSPFPSANAGVIVTERGGSRYCPHELSPRA